MVQIFFDSNIYYLWTNVGPHNFEKISNCDYLDRYCDCDMICDIRGNDNFYIIVLIFIEKHVKMIIVWFLKGSVPNKDVLFSLSIVMCRPGQQCGTTIFEIKWYFDTHFSLNKYCAHFNLKIAAVHIAIWIKIRFIVQPLTTACKALIAKASAVLLLRWSFF